MGEFIAWSRSIGAFLSDPGATLVAVLAFIVTPPLTFLAVQTMKRQHYATTGRQYSPARIQRCSWAWFVAISLLLQIGLYWGTPSRVPYNVAIVTTLIGVISYVGTVEWWIDYIRKHRPQLWAQLRTRRRSTDREQAERAASQVRSGDPDVTNH
jgi:hypothetical protein